MPCKSHPYVRISPDITHIARYYWCICRPSISLYIGTYLCISAVVYRLISMLLHIVHVQTHVHKKTKKNIYTDICTIWVEKNRGKVVPKLGGNVPSSTPHSGPVGTPALSKHWHPPPHPTRWQHLAVTSLEVCSRLYFTHRSLSFSHFMVRGCADFPR